MGKEQHTDLPPWERAASYREMARETEVLGESGSPEFRRNCRQFAARWRLLANELMTTGFEISDEEAEISAERQCRGPTDKPQSARSPEGIG